MSVNEATYLIPPAVESEPFYQAGIRFCRRYSSMISQGVLLGLDITFFISKLAYNSVVSKESLVALSALGFVGLPYNLDLIRKTTVDAHFGYKAHNKTVVVLASLKVVELVNNLALLGCNFAAAIEGLENEDAAQSNLYRSVTAWGESIIALGMGLNLAYMYVNYKTTKVLEVKDPAQILEAFQAPNEEIYHAAALRFCMDKDTLGVLLEKIHLSDEHENRMKIVRANLKTEQKVHLAAKFVFSVLGDVMMGVAKYFTPNSIVSAAMNLTAGILYTVISVVRYQREYFQRKKLA